MEIIVDSERNLQHNMTTLYDDLKKLNEMVNVHKKAMFITTKDRKYYNWGQNVEQIIKFQSVYDSQLMGMEGLIKK